MVKIKKKSPSISDDKSKEKKSYKPKMSVPVGDSFKEIREMNKKALKILAKRF